MKRPPSAVSRRSSTSTRSCPENVWSTRRRLALEPLRMWRFWLDRGTPPCPKREEARGGGGGGWGLLTRASPPRAPPPARQRRILLLRTPPRPPPPPPPPPP